MTTNNARSTSLTVTVTIVLVSVITLLLAMAGVVAYRSFRDDQWRTFHRQHAAIADQAAASFALPLWNFDHPTAETIAQGTLKNPMVSGLRVIVEDDHSTLLAHQRNSDWRDVSTQGAPVATGSVSAIRPILYDDERIGSVEVLASPRFVRRALDWALFSIIAGIAGLDIALVLGLYVLLRRLVLSPLRDIERYALAVSSGDSEKLRVGAITSGDEIASVHTSIVRMVAQLAAREVTLEELAEAQRSAYEQLGQLHRRLESAKEDERLFLSRELHDEMGQTLTALKLRLRVATGIDGPGSTEQRAEVVQLVERLIDRVRKVSVNLRPPLLDELGIEAALRALLDAQTGLAGAKLTLDTSGLSARLTPELEMVCFRIVQEAVTNVQRHAGAARAEVQVRQEGERVIVTVTDDGCGVSQEETTRSARSGHLGIVGMRERARSLGGEFSMAPAYPGAARPGTRIEVTLPAQPRPVSPSAIA